MGQEVRISDYEMETNGGDKRDCNGQVGDFGAGDDECVHEWVVGLPSGDALTPLSQLLVPPELATAFSISPEPSRTLQEVNWASRNTFFSIRACGDGGLGGASTHALNFKSFYENQNGVLEADDNDHNNNNNRMDRDGSDMQSRKLRKLVTDNRPETVDADSSAAGDARTLKRPRISLDTATAQEICRCHGSSRDQKRGA